MENDQPQPLRQWINKNSAAVTALTLACIVVALGVIVQEFKMTSHRPTIPMNGYYFDLATDQVFIAPLNQIPPIDVPGAVPGSPPQGVRAYIFACGDCDNPDARFLAWVETYTPESKARLLAALDPPDADKTGNTGGYGVPGVPGATGAPNSFPERGGRRSYGPGHLIATPDPHNPDWKNHWVSFRSEEGTELLVRAQNRCGPQNATNICSPPERNDKR